MDERETLELELRDGRPSLSAGAVRLELDNDNRPVLSLTRLSLIGIADLHQLASHTILKDAAGTTHQLEFADGGQATISYSESGKLRDLVVEGCGATVTADGEVLLCPYNVRPGEA